MGGVLAVGEGSRNSPRVVILQHLSEKQPKVGLVGKGITFDSGGISLKPANNLRKLKGDKAGAAAALAATLAAAQMGLDTPFVTVLPLAENMPSATAYRPGDVVTMLDGTTVDIVSTDAEGRMVLADAMVLAARRGCERLLTLATLTKASMVALGPLRAALYSSDDRFAEEIVAAGERVGEYVWRMPLDDDYARALESPVADVMNSGLSAWGGSIVAAKFLQRFAHEAIWAHIDMSPIFFHDHPMPWGDKGYTGAGARLALSLLAQADTSGDWE
jgi:leucyl aminopeptidase